MASPIEAIAANDAVAITPSDTTAVIFNAVYVGVAGNVAVRTDKGTTVTFVGVPAGTILPIKCTRVMATNTTATSLVGMTY